VGLTRQAGFAFPNGTHVRLGTLPYHCFWLMEKLSERSNITFLDMNKLEHLKKFLVSKKEKGGFETFYGLTLSIHQSIVAVPFAGYPSMDTVILTGIETVFPASTLYNVPLSGETLTSQFSFVIV
jgi:hypothetical protein